MCPSVDRCEQNTFDLSITESQAKRVENSLGSARAVAIDIIIKMDGRDSISTIGAEAGIKNGEKEAGRQTETMESGEGMGVVKEGMGIHPTSQAPKTDSGAEKMPTATKLYRCERGLIWGVRD